MGDPSPKAGGPVLRCAAIYFGIVFGVGFLLGSVRVPILVPRIGVRAAELAEMPLMFIAIFLAAGWIVRRFGSGIHSTGWLMVGIMALGLMIGAELLLVTVLSGRGIAEYIANRDPVSGAVYLAMLAVFAAMPRIRRGLAALDRARSTRR